MFNEEGTHYSETDELNNGSTVMDYEEDEEF